MTIITATDLKKHLGEYLERGEHEDIYVKRNGKIALVIKSYDQDKQAMLDSLVGIAAGDPITLEEARDERLARQ